MHSLLFPAVAKPFLADRKRSNIPLRPFSPPASQTSISTAASDPGFAPPRARWSPRAGFTFPGHLPCSSVGKQMAPRLPPSGNVTVRLSGFPFLSSPIPPIGVQAPLPPPNHQFSQTPPRIRPVFFSSPVGGLLFPPLSKYSRPAKLKRGSISSQLRRSTDPPDFPISPLPRPRKGGRLDFLSFPPL